jgi:DNA replication protein DnaC
MKTQNCQNCTQAFFYEPFFFGGREILPPAYCDDCDRKQVEQAKLEAIAAKRQGAHNEFWGAFPHMYAETIPEKLEAPLRAAIEKYSVNPKGLAFVGKSGTGKSRAMVLLLERLFHQTRSIAFLKATKLTAIASDQFSDDIQVRQGAREDIRKARSTKLLYIDDLGKGRMSATAEELLFAILDERSENLLPTFWTSNSRGADLHRMFSNDRADAIIRRLVDFTKIITIQ